jgi:DNA repair exonuclease SbcCD ATPase subunit
MKIAHFADIHFRGLARHSEYKIAFEDAFNSLREINPDLIYIGGDIVHSKTQGITPELIDILSWWFESLAKIAPVDVILGNHDGLIMNKNRQDAISPIISTLNNPRIRLMKKSGTYETLDPDVLFHVFSLFDREPWEDVKIDPSKVNIALYHGSVKGAVSDTDYELEGETNLSFFERFDFSLLGDIHKRQFLNKQRTIAYPGSTIQQNYSEENRKGFLVWDIRSKNDFDVEFHSVKNVHPFLTVEIDDVHHPEQIVKSIPGQARVRFDIKTRDAIKVREICNLVESSCSPVEITYKTLADSVISTPERVQEISTIDVKQSLVDFIKRRELPSEIESETLQKLDFYLKSRQGAEDEVRNVKWDLNKIDFDNLFAYGDSNSIDFRKLPGITGIFGKNRSGKSSIIGSITYGLFNTTDRGSMKNLHVINSKKEFCKTKINLSVSSDEYEITRETVKNYPKKSEVWASTTLSVSKVENGLAEHVDLNDEQRRETEKVLRRLIGTSDDFFYTCLSPQGNMNLFINEKSTARKQMLTRFLDIDYFEDLNNKVKSDIAPYKTKLKLAGSEIECNEQIKICEDKIENLEQEKEETQTKIGSLRDKINDATSKVPHDQIKNRRELSRLESEKASIESELEKIRQEKSSLEEKIESIKDKSTRAQSALEGINFSDLEKMAVDQTDIRKQIISEEKDLNSRQRERDTLLKSVELLDVVPCMGQYPTCQFICQSHANKEKLPVAESQVTMKQRAIDILKNRASALERDNPVAALEKAKKIKDLSRELESDLKAKHSKEEILNERIASRETNLSTINRRIIEISELTRDTNESDEKLISDLERDLKDCESRLIKIATEIGIQTEKIRHIKNQISEINSSIRALRILETLELAFSKKGVPQEIISHALPKINQEIGEILDGIAGFTVEIDCDDSNSVEIYLNYGDNKRLIELGSGMEKMIASIAIRVALTNISSLPKSSMFIIDEGFGALDDSNLEACARLLTNLKTYFKNILIISHVDAIKDIVDNVVDIGWEDGFAKVSC